MRIEVVARCVIARRQIVARGTLAIAPRRPRRLHMLTPRRAATGQRRSSSEIASPTRQTVGEKIPQRIANAFRVPIPTLFDGAPTADHSCQQSVQGLLAKPRALRLLLAFDKINDEAARLAVLHLVESLPQGAARRSRKRNGG
jgi:hypothetical protein